MLSGYMRRTWDRAQEENHRAILGLVEPAEVLLDCGCDDGALTQEAADAAGAGRVLGIEIDGQRASIASGRGVEVIAADLAMPFPLGDSTVGQVLLNQVIEHLQDTDMLLAEVRRVLEPGGVAVISTENLSSWPNVLSLALGWQPFSSTNMSALALGVGNPLAAHRGTPGAVPGMRHLRLFAPRGLTELVELHGLRVEALAGAGYFPLAGRPARLLAGLDRRHAAFLTVKARKPS